MSIVQEGVNNKLAPCEESIFEIDNGDVNDTFDSGDFVFKPFEQQNNETKYNANHGIQDLFINQKKRKPSLVCSATLEFDYRFGWVPKTI